MAVLLLAAAILAIWCIYNGYCLLLNYHHASRLKIPIVCVPITPDNPIWIALQTSFSSVFKYVPFDYFSVTRYCRLGWEFHDRYKTHQRLGDAWILVTPDKNWFHTSHAEAACDIFARSREFGRPVWMSGRIIRYPILSQAMAKSIPDALNVFGPNVTTVRNDQYHWTNIYSFQLTGRRI